MKIYFVIRSKFSITVEPEHQPFCPKVIFYRVCLSASLVPRPSSTLTFGGPGMPNQIFKWVEPRQRFCTQCHYDNFWERPQQLTVCWRSQELLPSLVSGCQVVLAVSIARCSGSPDGVSCCQAAYTRVSPDVGVGSVQLPCPRAIKSVLWRF